MGIGKAWKGVLLLAVGAAGGGAAFAVASVPDSTGVIHACVELGSQASSGLPATTTGNLRIIDPGSQATGQTCHTSSPAGALPSESSIAWNTAGPPGPAGTNGTNGAPGAPGRSVTVAGGNTLTLAGGQVVTVGRAPTLTIAAPLLSRRNIATITFTGGLDLSAEIRGYSFATGQAGGGPSHGSGRAGAALRDIQITKAFDKSSAKLAQACVTGIHIKKATITVLKHGKGVIYTLGDVLVAADQTGGSGGSGGDTPTETITLDFTKIEIKYQK